MNASYRKGKEPKSFDYLAKKLIYLVELNSERSDFHRSGNAAKSASASFISLRNSFNALLLPLQRDNKLSFYINAMNTEQVMNIKLNILEQCNIDITLRLDGERLESFQTVSTLDKTTEETNNISFTIDLDKRDIPVWVSQEKDVVPTTGLAEFILKYYMAIAIDLYPAFGSIR
ncbi:hypothetical protein F6R98_15310 [Candidatus Methylospira mobilis]|uniref:Uncharacterized protein n=2 Tax=Candidatus Methylospira mobilis TaxID=1808979 RepID=A0A5Q0BJV2_9GAMM|nr:hypothetical protein F6R98_15310 [Candidatus Methylospira mobilis]